MSRRTSIVLMVAMLVQTISCSTLFSVITVTNTESKDYEPLCRSLQTMGYKFTELDLHQSEFTPSGKEFMQTDHVGIIALTDINRNYDASEPVSEAEYSRLLPQAKQVCNDIQQSLGVVPVQVMQWDWVSGVRIMYGVYNKKNDSFSDAVNCNELSAYSTSFGSYGNNEVVDSNVCPSLKVTH